jgi:hypothetical protein
VSCLIGSWRGNAKLKLVFTGPVLAFCSFAGLAQSDAISRALVVEADLRACSRRRLDNPFILLCAQSCNHVRMNGNITSTVPTLEPFSTRAPTTPSWITRIALVRQANLKTIKRSLYKSCGSKQMSPSILWPSEVAQKSMSSDIFVSGCPPVFALVIEVLPSLIKRKAENPMLAQSIWHRTRLKGSVWAQYLHKVS